ncbi:MAG TPA: cation:proton antiporter [Polyangiaceae bacterium]|nr:cation:proton antiporter [Polyangiaceae bacterium]
MHATALADPATADAISRLGLSVAILLVAAKLGGEVAVRLGQSAVLGELLAGVLLGSIPLHFFVEVRTDPYVDMLARLGILVLLFEVGLGSTIRDVASVAAAATAVAALGTLGSLAFGVVATALAAPGDRLPVRWFVAGAITATSIGISARVLRDAGAASTRAAHTILGASVLDDVLGLLVLAVLTELAQSADAGARVAWIGVAWGALKTIAFLGASIAVGVALSPRLFALTSRLQAPGTLLATGLSFCFVFAWASNAMGLSPIVGAFTAGLVLEELHSSRFVQRGEPSLVARMEPISAWLVPIFFVLVGMRADIRALFQPAALTLGAALVTAAMAGKLACALGAPRGTDRIAIALGMLPRGEVTLVFANLGSSLRSAGRPLLDPAHYSALVTVVVVTTLVTPIALRRRLRAGLERGAVRG